MLFFRAHGHFLSRLLQLTFKTGNTYFRGYVLVVEHSEALPSCLLLNISAHPSQISVNHVVDYDCIG